MCDLIILCALVSMFWAPLVLVEWLCWRFDAVNELVTGFGRLLGFREEDRRWR